jgi:2-furoate---CoA ligase
MLARALTIAAERSPAAEAIADGVRRATYAAFEARVNRVAASLARLGLVRGEHVALLLKNREEHVALYWACQKLGLIATPLNWRYAEGEVRFCVGDAEAAAVVFEPASRAAVLAARRDLPSVRRWIHVGAEAPADTVDFESLAAGSADPGPPGVAVADGDVSIMLYTSGTTGRPKGVPRTHRAEAAAALAHVVQSRNAFGERTLGAMPLYHTMGVRSMIAMAFLHGALICLPDWNAAAAAGLLQDMRVSALYLVPTLYHDLVALPDIGRYHLATVTKLGYAGAPMSPTLTRRVAEVFHPQVFVNHLGSTEVYTFTVCDRVLDKPACAGRSGLFGRSRIVRADAERKGSPNDLVVRGETGELIVAPDSP